jgi:hypothetical protein
MGIAGRLEILGACDIHLHLGYSLPVAYPRENSEAAGWQCLHEQNIQDDQRRLRGFPASSIFEHLQTKPGFHNRHWAVCLASRQFPSIGQIGQSIR